MSFRPNVSAHFETNLLQLIAESGIAKINMVVAILISHLQLFREKNFFTLQVVPCNSLHQSYQILLF